MGEKMIPGDGGQRKKKQTLEFSYLFMGPFFVARQQIFNTLNQHGLVYTKVSACAFVFILLALLCH